MANSKKPFKGYNKKKHSRTGGLNDKYRKKINREEGSNLKRPVTGKVKQGSKAANRRKSFCARMSGVKGPTSKDGELTPKGAALKRWKCRKSLQKSDVTPKQKLAMFLREHLDNKLALKAAEPTITKSNMLPGGKGDTKDISDFDAREAEMGMKVELEHTKDINVAKEIVADHLSEDPAYYSKLKDSGLADELEKAGRCWEGYEPTPGKKPYSKGSCRKIKKSELNKSDVSLHLINQFEGSPTSPTEHHYSVKHKGQEVGRAIVFDKDPKSIHNAGKLGPSLKDIRIKSEHQGKGLAGQIINKLVAKHGPLASDSRGNISEFGAKMFAKYGTKQQDNSYVLGGKMEKSAAKQKLIKALSCKQKESLQKTISAMAIESGDYKGEQLDSHHHNRIGQEYRAMAKQAHAEGNKNKAREYHEKALAHFRTADKMGFQEEEPLEKKISGKLVGAGLTALSAFYANKEKKTLPQTQPLIIKQSDIPAPAVPTPSPKPKMSEEDMFLHNISQLESSGGKNTNHPIIKDKNSMHYGMQAAGKFALMPLTIKEIAKRHALAGGNDERILKIQDMDAKSGEINKYINENPKIELELARHLAAHVLERHGYTPEAAFSWKHGHNLTPKQIQDPKRQNKMNADSYVEKFKLLQEGKSPKGLTPAISLNIDRDKK